MTIEGKGTEDSRRFVDPGFLLAPAVGSMVAGMVDGNSWYAMGAAFAVGYIGPSMAYAQIIAPMLRRAGTLPEGVEKAAEGNPEP